MKLPEFSDVAAAARRITPYVHRTPVMTSSALNALYGAELYFKCENFQKAGAFKARGAANAVLCLSETEAARGVATHSSGNHGAALALAARSRGIPAYVVMPENSAAIKIKAVESYGAQRFSCGPGLAARETALDRVVARTGAVFIPPYDNFEIIAGQGSAALELCQDNKNLDIIIAPVGGGGLLSGTALAVNGFAPGIEIIAAEPANADDAYHSLQAGRIIPPQTTDTIADGLRTALGELTFAIMQHYVRTVVTVTEEDIVAAMRDIWERMKIVVEPSAAVALGALRARPGRFRGKRVGLLLSGGNVDLDHLPWIKSDA